MNIQNVWCDLTTAVFHWFSKRTVLRTQRLDLSNSRVIYCTRVMNDQGQTKEEYNFSDVKIGRIVWLVSLGWSLFRVLVSHRSGCHLQHSIYYTDKCVHILCILLCYMYKSVVLVFSVSYWSLMDWMYMISRRRKVCLSQISLFLPQMTVMKSNDINLQLMLPSWGVATSILNQKEKRNIL